MDSEELITVDEAAARCGINKLRFLGYCMDRRPWMPRSDGRLVYADSLTELQKYLAADHSSGGAS
jgi:hypothetical protein